MLLGKPEEAAPYYRTALEACERIRLRPEIALIRLSLAELLLEHYPDEREAAIEYLDFAIGGVSRDEDAAVVRARYGTVGY